MFKSKYNKKLEEELLFMNPVDAAYHRKPRFGIRLLSIGTIIAFLLLLLWAYLTQIDEVARASGTVIHSQGIQSIEHLEGGILQNILVREGDRVKKNSVLVRISNEARQSEYKSELQKSYALRASIRRYVAELNGTEPEFEYELYEKASNAVENETNLFEANKRKHASELNVLQAEYRLKEQELEASKHKQSAIGKSLALNREHLSQLENLNQKQLASKIDLLKQREIVIEQELELETLLDLIQSLQLEIELAEKKYILREDEIYNETANKLNQARTELATLNQSVLLGSSRLSRAEVRSPVDGIVKSIFITTIGAVVQPGMPIMEIVPLDDSLLVEAKIRPADIGFIQVHQEAIIKISAYDFSVFGGIKGKVEHISADTIKDKEGNVYYLANIRTEQNYLEYEGKKLDIIPGMLTSVDILTGKKSVLTFIMKPIMKTKENAFTER